jgi:hypothetical protein
MVRHLPPRFHSAMPFALLNLRIRQAAKTHKALHELFNAAQPRIASFHATAMKYRMYEGDMASIP